MNHNLISIFERIAEATVDEEDCSFSVEELWKWVVFDSENSSLNNSLTIHSPSGFAIKGRIAELDKTKCIEGEYYLFDYIDHAPSYRLIKLDNPQEVVNLILSDSGIFNVFTTIQLPIIKGQVYSLKEIIELIYASELDEGISFQELINDFQEIINKGINDNTYYSSLKEAGNCIITYKEKGISQQKAYDIIFAIKLVYRVLEINHLDDFIDEVLDYICGYIGNKELWIWEKKL